MAPALPAGDVTFLFTDVVGSTQHFASLGDAWAAVVDQHDAFIADAVSAHAGVVVKIQGDSAFAAFSAAENAVAAAVAVQRRLRDAEWPGDPLRVRIGLHRAEATPRRGDYVALGVHHASRYMAVAGPGQILCSDAVMDAVDREQLPEGCTAVDLGRFWLKDIHPAPRIWGLRIDDDDAGTKSPHAPTAAAEVPRVRSSFHGRDDDLLRVDQAILDHPLTSIVGPGGAGKTRLALEAVGRAEQPGRVCFVDLTSLAPAAGADPLALDAVAGAILRSAGAIPQAGVPALDVLTEHLVDNAMLVVLDNCEHVIDATAAVCDALMRFSTRSRILATSRAPLEVDGEEVIAIGPLDLPDEGTEDSIFQSPAVRLLSDRARQARGGKPLAPEELTALIPSLRAVGPLPLTVELVAARLRTLSPADLARRLHEPLDVLSVGARQRAPRHRSLRDVIEWSARLLDPDARQVLLRSTVFVAHPTVADLEVVAAGGAIQAHHVLDAVDRLVASSLATIDEAGSLAVPMPVRAWAVEELVAAGDAELAADHHLARIQEIATDDPARLAASLRADLAAALVHAHRRRDNLAVAALVVAAASALETHSGWHEVWDVAADAIRPSIAAPASRQAAEALVVVARWAIQMADAETAALLAAGAVTLAVSLDDASDLLAAAHVAVAGACGAFDDPSGARRALAEAEEAAGDADELTRLQVRRAQIGLLNSVPAVERLAGLRDLLPRVVAAGDRALLTDTRVTLAITEAQLVSADGTAADEAGRLLDTLLESGDSGVTARDRVGLFQARSAIRWHQGELEDALADLAAGVEAATSVSDHRGRVMMRSQAAGLAAAGGRGLEAAALYEEVLAFAERRAPYWIDDARALLIDVQLRRRATGEVRRHLDQLERTRSAERKPSRTLTFDIAREWLRLHLDPAATGAIAPMIDVAESAGVRGGAEIAFVRLGPMLATRGRLDDVAWLLRRAAHENGATGQRFKAVTTDALALVGAAAGVGSPMLGSLLALADAGYDRGLQERMPEEAAAIDAIRVGAPVAALPEGSIAEAFAEAARGVLAFLEGVTGATDARGDGDPLPP